MYAPPASIPAEKWCLNTLPNDTCRYRFPYTSVADFKAKNPNCCSVLKDFSNYKGLFAANLRGEEYPKMYSIDVTYKELWLDKNGQRELKLNTTPNVLTCFGGDPYDG
jgi:hypothetical protein